MDRVENYRQIVREAIRKWANFYAPEPGTENVLIFDEKTDNYVWIQTGWSGKKHINHTVLHLSIRGETIHVHHDGISDGIVNELLAAGVPESDILLEWHPPHRRKLTPFAVA